MDCPLLIPAAGATLSQSVGSSAVLVSAGLFFVQQCYATIFDIQPGGNRLIDEQGNVLTDESGDHLTW